MKIITACNHALKGIVINPEKEIVLNISLDATSYQTSDKQVKLNLHPDQTVKSYLRHGMVAEAVRAYEHSLSLKQLEVIINLAKTRTVIILSSERPETFNLRYIIAAMLHRVYDLDVLELGYTKDSYNVLKSIQEELHKRPLAPTEYKRQVGV